MTFVKGDIILPKIKVARQNWLTGLYHAAVVWQDDFCGKDDFQGIILTHSEKYPENILMQELNFVRTFAFKFDKTCFVNQVFVKFGSWGPFEKVGQLTKVGVSFVEGNIDKAKTIAPFQIECRSLSSFKK